MSIINASSQIGGFRKACRARALDLAGNEGVSATVLVDIVAGAATIINDTLQKTSTASVDEKLLDMGNVQGSYVLDLDRSPGRAVGSDPGLLYDSSTVHPAPVVQVTVQSDNSLSAPNDIIGTLTWDGADVASNIWSTAGLTPGENWNLALQAPANQTTDRHIYTLHLTLEYPNPANNIPLSVTDQTFAVNYDANAFGAGWNLSYLERLYPISASGSYPAGELRVIGDGEWDFFALSGSTYTPPNYETGSLAAVTGGFQYTAKDKSLYNYDSSGYLKGWVSGDGANTFTFTYDGSNNLLTATTPDGAVTSFVYASGKVSDIIVHGDSGGARTTTLTYTGSDLTAINGPDADAHTFSYSGDLLTQEIDGLTQSAWTYDDSMAATFQKGSAPAATIFPALHEGIGTVDVGIPWGIDTDPLGGNSEESFDRDGHSGSEINADQVDPSVTRNFSGFITSSTDGLGRVTTFTVDSLGYDTAIQKPDGSVTTFTYDSTFHNVLTQTDARGDVTSFTYNGAGQMLTMTDPIGHVTSYTYTAAGDQQTITDPLGHVTTSIYDSDRRLQATVSPLNERTTLAYDTNGNPSTVTDSLGHVTTTVYDAGNHLTKSIDALGHATTYIVPDQILIAFVAELKLYEICGGKGMFPELLCILEESGATGPL